MDKAKTRKSKDLLFHALTSIKRLQDGIGRSLRYSFPHPASAVSAKDLDESPGCAYLSLAPPEEHVLPVLAGINPAIRYRFEQINSGVVPERFVLELENGRVFGAGHVITSGNRLVSDVSVYFSQHDTHWLIGLGNLPDPQRLEGTVAVLDSSGSSNYFHWTLDTLPRVDLLKDYIDGIDWFYIGSTEPFQQAWLEKLGIPRKKILAISPHSHIQADRLLVPSFSHKSGIYADAAYEFVRSFRPSLPAPTRKIYVSRSNARRRKIMNEEDILPFLRGQGYEVHHLTGKSIDEQMELFGSASHIIAPHGAELTNLVYCQPGTKVLEIFSPHYINLCYWTIAAQTCLNYSCLLGKGGASGIRKQKNHLQVWRNINIDEDQLKAQMAVFMRSET